MAMAGGRAGSSGSGQNGHRSGEIYFYQVQRHKFLSISETFTHGVSP